MVGLEILPIAKLNHNRTEGLRQMAKRDGRGGKHFFFLRKYVITVVKATESERGNVYSCTLL